MCAGVLRDQDGMLASMGLLLQVTEPPDEVLGSELRSSGRLAICSSPGNQLFHPQLIHS